MKAIRFDRYGPPEVLQLRDVLTPHVGNDDVLVRVRAASLNPQDWHLMVGLPLFMRAQSGWRRPRITGIGSDLAGTVEAIGVSVDRVGVGDEVYGRVGTAPGSSSLPDLGAVAEYVRVPATSVSPVPAGLTAVEAASLPLVGITALQGLRDVSALRPGEHVLVNGASGGVGTAAMQVAKAMGAEVTGVCSSRNVELVRSLGADHVVDYTRTDPTDGPARYDVVLDNVGNHPGRAWLQVLAGGGRYVASFDHPHRRVGGPLGSVVRSMVRFAVTDRRVVILQQRRREEDLDDLSALVETGSVRPLVDRTYSIADTRVAMDDLTARRARGKLVVSVEEG